MSVLFGFIATLLAISSFVGLVTDDFEEYYYGGLMAIIFGTLAWWFA